MKPSEGCNLLGSQGTCDLGVSLASLPCLARIAVGCRLRPQGWSQRGAGDGHSLCMWH